MNIGQLGGLRTKMSKNIHDVGSKGYQCGLAYLTNFYESEMYKNWSKSR